MSAAAFLGALAVVAAFPVLWWAVSGSKLTTAAASRNLRASFTDTLDYRQAVLGRAAHERAVGPTIERILAGLRRHTPIGMVERLEQRLLIAGGPAGWPVDVLAVKVAGSAAAATGASVWFFGAPSGGRFLIGVAVVGFLYFLPDILIYNATTKRKLAIQRELSDTLDQLTVCVEAGLSLESALLRVSTSGAGPLHRELARTIQDISAGMGRADAFKGLTGRTRVDDLDHFVMAVVQAETHGLPVSRVLRVQATEMRVKRRQRAEEAAMKLPVKILFPVLLFIFPTLFIVLLGPAAIKIFEALG